MIERLVNIVSWLDADSISDWQTKLARDREILIKTDGFSIKTPFDQVLAWWTSFESETENNLPGKRIKQILFLSSIATIITGLAFGAGVAAAVLFYDGSTPINIFWAYLWLIVLPLLMLILSLFLPWSKTSGLLHELSIGRLLQSLLAMIVKSDQGNFITRLSAFESYVRWRLAATSQLFGLSFAIATLLVLLVKVTLSDLAFAWGSSLQLENNFVSQVTTILSAPWSNIVPQAVPDTELIEASRYFRLSDVGNPELAELLTQWWPFLAMGIIVYGIVLRAALFILASVQSRRRLKLDFLAQPDVAALVERLNTPVLGVVAAAQESPDAVTISATSPDESTAIPTVLICWQQAQLPKTLAGLTPIFINSVRELHDPSGALEKPFPENGALVIATKAWEPPLLEFHDVIAQLREQIEIAVPIIVMPIDEQGDAGRESDKAIWRQSLAKIKDSQLFVQ